MQSQTTIASGATTSATILIDTYRRLSGIAMPSAFTGATITFEAAIEGDTTVPGQPLTWQQVVSDAGAAYSITVAASKFFAIPRDKIPEGVRFIRIVSASSEAAARTITLVFGHVT